MSTPQIVNDTVKEISKLIAYLIEIGLVNDQNFPSLNKHSGEIWEVSFSESGYLSSAYNDASYEAIYNELNERRCYSIRFLDGGILQISFRFKANEVIKHRLAYYPSPNLTSFSQAPESYEIDELYAEIITRKIIPFPVRFDFDCAQAQDIHHPHSHLTLGDIKNCRLPVSAALSPKWFIEFIIRCFYIIENKDFISKLPKSELVMPATITRNEKKLIHLCIPY